MSPFLCCAAVARAHRSARAQSLRNASVIPLFRFPLPHAATRTRHAAQGGTTAAVSATGGAGAGLAAVFCLPFMLCLPAVFYGTKALVKEHAPRQCAKCKMARRSNSSARRPRPVLGTNQKDNE